MEKKTEKAIDVAMFNLPTRKDIEAIKVGDLALDCWGHMRRVTQITARREDIHGKLFCCYYTDMGNNSSCSMSQKEDELTRTVGVCCKFKSRELDNIEKALLESR